MSTQTAFSQIEIRLVWLMVLRVLVVTILLGLAVATEVIARPETPVHPLYFLIALTYFFTLLYALAWPLTGAYRRQTAYAQIFTDLAVISGVVYFTGGAESNFSRLYFISIISASIILYRRGGLVAAATASLMYGGVLELVHWQVLPAYPYLGAVFPFPTKAVHFTIFLNTFLFFTVGFLTSYLSESLRETGRELEVASDHLADLQAFNQTVIDSLSSGLMTTDTEGRINFFNDAAQAILKVKAAQAMGQKAGELLGEDEGFIERIDSMLEVRRYCRMEGAYLNGHGDEIYLGLSVSHLLYKGESRSGFLFTFQDLTEIKRLENEVRLKENLATMGEMAAGMAHEIRNPLASISGSVQVLEEELGLAGENSRLMDIILDEIGEMSPAMQVKLLRVLQDKRIRRIGSTEEIEVDVRIIAASNKDLERMVGEKTFREDLFYRLNVIPVHMVPLRERRDDIPMLAEHFLTKANKDMNKRIAKISDEAMELMTRCDWPGNVRELENVIERAVALEPSQVILPERLPEKIQEGSTAAIAAADGEGLVELPEDGLDFHDHIGGIERRLLSLALERAGGVQTRAAKFLHMNLRSFRYLLQKYDLR